MAPFPLCFIGLFLLLCVHQSYQWNIGPCPTKHYVLSFRPNKWLGTWFEYQRKEQPVWENYSKCNQFEFGSENKTYYSMLAPITQTPVKIPVEVESVSGIERDANYIWNFKFPFFSSKRKVFVLSTNYYDWAIVWSCQNYFFINYQTAWILTRESSPSRTWVLKAIQKAVDLADLNIKDFEKVNHENCSNQTSPEDF